MSGRERDEPSPEPDPLDLRLALPAVAAWVVAWQARLVPPGAVVLFAVTVAGLGVLVLLRSRARAAALAAAVCACAAAAGLATAARVHARQTGPLAEAARTGAAVTVVGVLTDDPRQVPPKVDVLAFRPLTVAHLRVERLLVAGRDVGVRAPVLVLSADQRWVGLLPSQRVRSEGRLQLAAAGDDVAALLSTRGPPIVLGRASALQRVAGHLRAGLRAAARPLPSDERGLLPGLVDGDTSGLDPALQDDFRTTGLTHVVAVSGTNVAVVLASVLVVCGWLGVGRRWRPPVAGIVLVAFVVLARPSPSVLRAAAMGSIGLVALATGSRRQALPALSAAVLVLVLLSPELAAAPGFALSTLATAGLLVLAPPWRARLATRLPGWLADAIAVPAAAQVACGPVVVAISGSVGLLSVPANLLAVPAVAPATVLGVVAALLAPVCLPLAQAVAWLAWLPTRWLTAVAHLGARQPGSGLTLPKGQLGALLMLVLTGAVLLLLWRRLLRRVVVAGLVGTLVAVVGVAVTRPAWPPPGWVLVTCDVGQGDGHVVRLGRGTALVVDTGPEPRAIDRCLRRLGIHRIPLLVLTHLHADHVEGVPGLLRGRQLGEVEIGPLDEPAVERERLLRWTSARHIPVVRAYLGEVRQVGDVSWEVLDATARRGTDSDPNNSSIVLRLNLHGVRVLFAGDLERDAQQSLLDRGLDVHAEVLKVPHHGSAKQQPAFLDAVGARVALTPVGAGNRYGHPSPTTLRRLEDDGARTYRSDLDGDVAIVADHGRLAAVGHDGDGVTRRPSLGAPNRWRSLPPTLEPVRRQLSPPLLGLPSSAMTECDAAAPATQPAGVPEPVGRSPPPAGIQLGPALSFECRGTMPWCGPLTCWPC